MLLAPKHLQPTVAAKLSTTLALPVAAGLLATAVFLTTSAPALARPAPITGKLTKPGYTVVALAKNGKARTAKRNGAKFRVAPPAGTVTLHLRARDGTYGGPFVFGKSGKRAVVGVRAGARLGNVRVLNGYAKPRKTVARRFLDRSRTAQARNGIPVGAGVFGRVQASGQAKASAAAGDGEDQDLDGLPSAFDVDDDGDLLLDNFEGQGGGGLPPAASGFRVFSNLKLQIVQSLNANATAVTDAQIDQAMSSTATLAIQVASGGDVELDCGGLTYCSKDGTGRVLANGAPGGGPRFPDEFDSDGDGFGTLAAGPTGDFQLLPGAKSSEIGSGDTYVERITSDGTETQVPGMLNYIFSTTPALTSWSQGTSSGSVSYPVTQGAPGTAENPLPVSASGDVIVTMTFWRPQRKAIAGSGEGSEWVDIGHLKYTADVPNGPGGPGPPPGAGPGNCPGSTYSTSDPNLTVTSDGVLDKIDDRPSDPANTLTFSVNLTQCLATKGLTWGTGQNLQVDIQARSQFGDNAAQLINFRRQ